MKRLLRVLVLFIVRLAGLFGSRGASYKPSGAPKILLLRPDHLGDVILTTPVLIALKQRMPEAHVTFMVGPWSSEIVARHPAIDRIVTCSFPGFRRAPQGALAPYILLFNTARQLQRGKFDLAINLRPDFWWGAALLYLAAIPRRVGYQLHPGAQFLTHALPFVAPEHATVSNLRLLSAALQTLDYPALEEPYTPERYPLRFVPTGEEYQWAEACFRDAGIASETPVLAIAPGTGAAVKLWRSEAWARCADALVKSTVWRRPPRVVLTGSAAERPLLEKIAGDMAEEPLLITHASVGQLAALLGKARCVLAVDNGPAHIAVAQDTPTLQLFGPTDPRIFGPWGSTQRHVIITSTERCPSCPAIPCNRLDFTAEELAAHPCVRLLKEEQVIAGAEALVRQTEPSNADTYTQP